MILFLLLNLKIVIIDVDNVQKLKNILIENPEIIEVPKTTETIENPETIETIENPETIEEWKSYLLYNKNYMVKYNNNKYLCIQNHISNAYKTPDKYKNLWILI